MPDPIPFPAPDPFLFHGGALDKAAAMFRIPRESWLDLSTGINPRVYPVPDISPETWHRLPDETAMRRLQEAAAARYGAADPEQIVPTPGTQAAIQWLPRLLPRTTVAVVAPTYAEHAHCWRAAGHQVVELDDPAQGPNGASVLILVNPNNPTGRRIAPGKIQEIASRYDLCVVDEAFMDMTPEESMAPRVASRAVVVLRSFGKFYGLAGLRLGFAVADAFWSGRLRSALGPWAVSGPALEIGRRALRDTAWAGDTISRLAKSARRLDELLDDRGLPVLGGTDLFRLVGHDRARELHGKLARSGILVRRFDDRPAWLRFGLPGAEADWERLAAALA